MTGVRPEKKHAMGDDSMTRRMVTTSVELTPDSDSSVFSYSDPGLSMHYSQKREKLNYYNQGLGRRSKDFSADMLFMAVLDLHCNIFIWIQQKKNTGIKNPPDTASNLTCLKNAN